MNRICATGIGIAIFIALSFRPTSVVAQASPTEIGHGAFPTKVSKTLDSSKLKEGDAVELETSGSFKLPSGMLIPKGSKLLGRVTTAKARAKGDSESQLLVTFDKLNVLNGKSFSVKGVVQAVFPPADEPDPGIPFSTVAKGGAPMSTGGMSQMPTPGYQPTDPKSGSNTDSGGHVDYATDPKAVGAHGMHDLSLEDGVLRSQGKQVKLGNGVRLIVKVEIFEYQGT